jgi:hypothetical protein
MRNVVLATLALLALCLVSRTAAADDVQSLQGTWETKVTSNGIEYRVEKSIDGQKETVRTFDGANLLHEHVVEFELKTDGDVKVFRWKNGKVTAGPQQGQPLADGAFIYRLEQKQWTAVFGMLRTDTGPIYSQVFTREPAE